MGKLAEPTAKVNQQLRNFTVTETIPIRVLDNIGARLRTLRRGLGLTLDQLASDSGLSAGYLSQIESGMAVPSLTALQLIAAGVGTDLSDFFIEEPRRGTQVTRREARSEFRLDPRSGEAYAVLAGQIRDGSFSALVARHYGGDRAIRPFGHLGEELCVVLAGQLRVTIESESIDLGPGDWLHYPSHPQHAVEVTSEEPAEVLWLVAPAVV